MISVLAGGVGLQADSSLLVVFGAGAAGKAFGAAGGAAGAAAGAVAGAGAAPPQPQPQPSAPQPVEQQELEQPPQVRHFTVKQALTKSAKR